MTPEQFTSRIEAFALRDGLTFASLIGLSPADRVIVVATMAALFDPNGVGAACGPRRSDALMNIRSVYGLGQWSRR